MRGEKSRINQRWPPVSLAQRQASLRDINKPETTTTDEHTAPGAYQLTHLPYLRISQFHPFGVFSPTSSREIIQRRNNCLANEDLTAGNTHMNWPTEHTVNRQS
ncbi:hypothetical protein [Mycolicibacterium mucogenicum]|uniref:Uncharacterized protein n=1 Tax=Mycolicibacterium mucogenicum DSM 44124 TaxID=1226753 RepID=A0A8E4R660_MYCMU|nr:hypothetical protein [Mycolicibacterium mucogenicum]QPG68607.1 hypothetical protein C1S78_024685 [Mycolicibacterium mucogenicum DSM 44124]